MLPWTGFRKTVKDQEKDQKKIWRMTFAEYFYKELK